MFEILYCQKYENVRSQVLSLWRKNIPICVEVFLVAACSCENNEFYPDSNFETNQRGILLEQWCFSISHHRTSDSTTPFGLNQLISAVRSQLHFSQISAWLSSQEEFTSKFTSKNFKYRLAIPGETYDSSKFIASVSKHNFPSTDVGNGFMLNVMLLTLPRMTSIPNLKCSKCELVLNIQSNKTKPDQENVASNLLFDDRMHTSCTLKGKHRCEDYDDFDSSFKKECKFAKSKRLCHKNNNLESCSDQTECPEPSTSNTKEKLLLDIGKAELYRTLNDKKKLELQQLNEKRNLSPNISQPVKSQKLDLDLNQSKGKNVMCMLMHQNSLIENKKKSDLSKQRNNKHVLLNAILHSQSQNDENWQRQRSTISRCEINALDNGDRYAKCDVKCVHKLGHTDASSINGWTKPLESVSDNSICDKLSERGDIFNNKEKLNIYVDSHCDSLIPTHKYRKMKDISNVNFNNTYKGKARQRITFEDEPVQDLKVSNRNHNFCDKNKGDRHKEDWKESIVKTDKYGINTSIEIPSPVEQAKFRKSLDNAASMVFHSRTGLPLTSSPAPVRRGKSFDFDSSINSVSAIKSALFSASFSTDDDSESDGSIVSPCSPDTYILPKREPLPVKYYRKGHAANLLGSFEESVLNGRLEPVSTVHGFSAELGASGSFVPRHLVVPVTVFFYTLGDNDKVSSPYLGHINLGKKGYNVPKMGTVQVTLFNPLGTVVKMFVIMYDLSDMPTNSQTFIRQRTLYMPTNCKDKNLEWGPKWLRYLIHLRFMSSKSGRIYLHSDIRMIIFRKSDLDTATAHGIDMSYELRSFTHMPADPKYSPRK